MKSSHLDRLAVTFDSPTLVSNAGLLLPAVLAQRLGLAELVRKHVHLGDAPGAPNPHTKAMTVVASLLAGGDCIDDVDGLRKGNTEFVLGSKVLAPSTVGTFLRSFSSGHARQLDAVLEDLIQRAWDAGRRRWRPQAGVKATRAIGSPGTCQFQEVPDARVETSIR